MPMSGIATTRTLREITARPVIAINRPQRPILVAVDDHRLRKNLSTVLEAEGYRTFSATNANEGLASLVRREPSLLLISLRDGDKELCMEAAHVAPQIPVVVLSSKTDVVDQVMILEMGAQDYITIPYHSRVLLARIRAALRRPGPTRSDLVTKGGFRMDRTRLEVRHNGRSITLRSLEFELLVFLSANAGRVLGRNELLDAVWGYDSFPSTRTVDNHILALRKKLEEDPANPRHLKTVNGVGYTFVS